MCHAERQKKKELEEQAAAREALGHELHTIEENAAEAGEESQSQEEQEAGEEVGGGEVGGDTHMEESQQ